MLSDLHLLMHLLNGLSLRSLRLSDLHLLMHLLNDLSLRLLTLKLKLIDLLLLKPKLKLIG